MKLPAQRIHPLIILAACTAVLLGLPTPARADIAPPERAPGANMEPDAPDTQVTMLAETVTLAVRANPPDGSVGQAQVTAVFQMHNQGTADEQMDVRFPLGVGFDPQSDFDPVPEIANLKAKVAGHPVTVRRVLTPDPQDPASGDQVPWGIFPVAFPAGKDVTVEVTYLQEGMGEYPFVAFRYVLETGAGWQGTIGSADLVVRLPYEASDQNVIFDEQIGWSQTTAGGAVSGNKVRWHFTDLEPTAKDDLQVSLVMPSAWNKVLAERENVTKNPRDGEAWGRLGKVYKEIVSYRRDLRRDPGGKELYGLSVEAYDKAVTLLPGDTLWHYGFADLLWSHYYWQVYMPIRSDVYAGKQPDLGMAELVRAVGELKASLDLDPDNSLALELLQEIGYSVDGVVLPNDGEPIYLYLTATPLLETLIPDLITPTITPSPIPSATLSPQLTATRPPDLTSTPTAAPIAATPTAAQPKSTGLPICGAGIVLPILFGVFLGIKPRG